MLLGTAFLTSPLLLPFALALLMAALRDTPLGPPLLQHLHLVYIGSCRVLPGGACSGRASFHPPPSIAPQLGAPFPAPGRHSTAEISSTSAGPWANGHQAEDLPPAPGRAPSGPTHDSIRRALTRRHALWRPEVSQVESSAQYRASRRSDRSPLRPPCSRRRSGRPPRCDAQRRSRRGPGSGSTLVVKEVNIRDNRDPWVFGYGELQLALSVSSCGEGYIPPAGGVDSPRQGGGILHCRRWRGRAAQHGGAPGGRSDPGRGHLAGARFPR